MSSRPPARLPKLASLVFTVLLIAGAGLLAWLRPPALATDPLAMLGEGHEVEATRAWMQGAARPGTVWLVIAGKVDGEPVAREAASALAARWQVEGIPRSDGNAGERDVMVEGPAEMLGNDLAELVAWAWLAAPEEEVARLEEELGSPAGVQRRLQRTFEELQYGLPGQGLIEGVRDPLRLRDVPALGDSTQLEEQFVAAGGDGTSGVIRLRAGSLESAQELVRWLREEELPGSSELDGLEWGLTGEAAYAREIEAAIRSDVNLSVIGTLLGMLLLFWLLDGRLSSLPVVGLPVVGAVAAAAVVASFGFNELHALGAGCAALLLGLVIDFAVVGLGEARHGAARWPAGAGIVWSALSTAVVFGSLVHTKVAGLAQFGLLIGVGIVAGAAIVLGPLWAWWRGGAGAPVSRRQLPWHGLWRWGPRLVGALAALALAGLLLRDWPGLEESGGMTPAGSRADWAMERLESGEAGASRSYLISPDALESAREMLEEARAAGHVEGYTLPPAAWIPRHAEANAARLASLAGGREALADSLAEAGFKAEARAIDERVLALWATGEVRLPAWLAGQVSCDGHGGFRAVVSVDGATPAFATTLWKWATPVGWEALSEGLMLRLLYFAAVGGLVVAVILLVILALALRSVRDVALAVGVLLLAGLLVQGFHALAGVGWSPFALATVPLLLGVGLDYQLHLLLAARRERAGEAGALARTATALLFCWATTLLGFGSLALARSPGLADLGISGALGVLAVGLVSLLALPAAAMAGRSPLRSASTTVPR